ncbi:unnamed protein product [Vitrella brassicaformis CCMP3155]|uniref:CBS domain-containing protein n=4 Tax=Vitrella brassicaformis TaxID=1169539 RepID=A0A0G4EI45_VITBC|nr:unnamed protein product [Vitrella brassicaformis CCMP3155]|eukprot:CEL95917.1 unnamed protein product [Vitrella brassicaformis CCMP3155]
MRALKERGGTLRDNLRQRWAERKQACSGAACLPMRPAMLDDGDSWMGSDVLEEAKGCDRLDALLARPIAEVIDDSNPSLLMLEETATFQDLTRALIPLPPPPPPNPPGGPTHNHNHPSDVTPKGRSLSLPGMNLKAPRQLAHLLTKNVTKKLVKGWRYLKKGPAAGARMEAMGRGGCGDGGSGGMAEGAVIVHRRRKWCGLMRAPPHYSYVELQDIIRSVNQIARVQQELPDGSMDMVLRAAEQQPLSTLTDVMDMTGLSTVGRHQVTDTLGQILQAFQNSPNTSLVLLLFDGRRLVRVLRPHDLLMYLQRLDVLQGVGENKMLPVNLPHRPVVSLVETATLFQGMCVLERERLPAVPIVSLESPTDIIDILAANDFRYLFLARDAYPDTDIMQSPALHFVRFVRTQKNNGTEIPHARHMPRPPETNPAPFFAALLEDPPQENACLLITDGEGDVTATLTVFDILQSLASLLHEIHHYGGECIDGSVMGEELLASATVVVDREKVREQGHQQQQQHQDHQPHVGGGEGGVGGILGMPLVGDDDDKSARSSLSNFSTGLSDMSALWQRALKKRLRAPKTESGGSVHNSLAGGAPSRIPSPSPAQSPTTHHANASPLPPLPPLANKKPKEDKAPVAQQQEAVVTSEQQPQHQQQQVVPQQPMEQQQEEQQQQQQEEDQQQQEAPAGGVDDDDTTATGTPSDGNAVDPSSVQKDEFYPGDGRVLLEACLELRMRVEENARKLQEKMEADRQKKLEARGARKAARKATPIECGAVYPSEGDRSNPTTQTKFSTGLSNMSALWNNAVKKKSLRGKTIAEEQEDAASLGLAEVQMLANDAAAVGIKCAGDNANAALLQPLCLELLNNRPASLPPVALSVMSPFDETGKNSQSIKKGGGRGFTIGTTPGNRTPSFVDQVAESLASLEYSASTASEQQKPHRIRDAKTDPDSSSLSTTMSHMRTATLPPPMTSTYSSTPLPSLPPSLPAISQKQTSRRARLKRGGVKEYNGPLSLNFFYKGVFRLLLGQQPGERSKTALTAASTSQESIKDGPTPAPNSHKELPPLPQLPIPLTHRTMADGGERGGIPLHSSGCLSDRGVKTPHCTNTQEQEEQHHAEDNESSSEGECDGEDDTDTGPLMLPLNVDHTALPISFPPPLSPAVRSSWSSAPTDISDEPKMRRNRSMRKWLRKQRGEPDDDDDAMSDDSDASTPSSLHSAVLLEVAKDPHLLLQWCMEQQIYPSWFPRRQHGHHGTRNATKRQDKRFVPEMTAGEGPQVSADGPQIPTRIDLSEDSIYSGGASADIIDNESIFLPSNRNCHVPPQQQLPIAPAGQFGDAMSDVEGSAVESGSLHSHEGPVASRYYLDVAEQKGAGMGGLGMGMMMPLFEPSSPPYSMHRVDRDHSPRLVGVLDGYVL